jgi:hypothetical protein
MAIVLSAASGLAEPESKWSRYFEQDPARADLYAMRPPDLFYHNAGLLRVMVTNVGVIGNPQETVETFGAGWKSGEYLHKIELWVGAVTPEEEACVSTGFEFRPSLDPIDTIYATFEGASGGDRAGFSHTLGDDDGDGEVDEDFLNGKDDDGDGRIDEDYAAISQQMLSCEFWDYTEEAMTAIQEHVPLNIRVRQCSYAWAMEGQNEAISFDYRIVNDGSATLEDVYLGWVVDGDVGRKDAALYWTDDLGEIKSCDTTYVDEDMRFYCISSERRWKPCWNQNLHLDIAYMYDARYEDGGEHLDDLPETADGCIGVMLLDHTTDLFGSRAPQSVRPITSRFLHSRDLENLEDYVRYQILAQGYFGPDSTEVPSDYTYLISVGPFPRLLPGEEIGFQIALLVGLGWEGLLDNAIEMKKVYKGKWRDADGHPRTGCDGAETCLTAPPGECFFWTDPCTMQGERRKVCYNDCRRPMAWVDNDCDCCTPPQSHPWYCDGLETEVRWVGALAPPAPALSLDDAEMRAQAEEDRGIFIEWDNYPELIADPISGEMRFCGYRVWRVEGWDRPVGSPGPAENEWELIADLSVSPRGSQLDLADFTNPYARIQGHVPSPIDPHALLDHYEVGRHFYRDTLGVKNGMLYFYDVTSYACWIDEDGYHRELSQPPNALEADGVCPRWDAVQSGWPSRLAVVPNPYRGSAAWDLGATATDPVGAHVDFIGLPDCACKLRIYTLAGDLVQTLNHRGSTGVGRVSWNFLSRNGQVITSGVYLCAVTCRDETVVQRFTIIR